MRYKVGADWDTYLRHYEALSFDDFTFNILAWDPAYVLVEYISKFLHLGIWGVNTICAIIFLTAFSYFVRTFGIPLSYGLLVAYPYLIVVAVNGYTRQGVAIGLVMAFYALVHKNKTVKAILILILATLFHKTAIINALVLLFDKAKSNRIMAIRLIVVVLLAATIYAIFRESFGIFIQYYFEHHMQSGGAIFRIPLNVLAVILLFVFKVRWNRAYADFGLWSKIGYLSIFMFIVAVYFKATTVTDRLVLYFYPLQIVVFTRIVYLIKTKPLRHLYFCVLVGLYLSVLLGWLAFATHRFYWIPYNNFIFKSLEG